MLYKPADIAATDRPIAFRPSLGGEWELYLSTQAAVLVGELRYTAAATATYYPESGVDLTADPADLQLVVAPILKSSAAAVIRVVGTDASDAVITGTGTFAPPSYALNQSFDFGVGAAVDVVVPGAAKFKTVTSVSAVSYGNAGSRIRLFRLPNSTSWARVGCLDSFEPTIGAPKAISVPCGMDASAFVIPGRGDVSSVTIKTKHFNLADGLSRFNGFPVCVRADRLASLLHLTERYVLGNAVLSANTSIGSGNDEASDTATGEFADPAFFWAQ